MFAVLRSVATGSGRSCRAGIGNIAAGGAASLTNVFPVLSSRSIVTPAVIISQSPYPRRAVTGQRVDLPGNVSKFELAYGFRAPAPSTRLFGEEVAEGAGASAFTTLSDHQARRSQLATAWGDRATRANFVSLVPSILYEVFRALCGSDVPYPQ